MASIEIKKRIGRTYRHREDGDEVFVLFEAWDGYIYYQYMMGIDDLMWMYSQQFYKEYIWIKD
ncbi:hypothetical protein [Paenibacillus polysaccharolyticus]|uniref:hypothetical protein n=1 Tax=Paenibacillus polysaccharolyticus TaxID=582692 RepID=UPI0030094261